MIQRFIYLLFILVILTGCKVADLANPLGSHLSGPLGGLVRDTGKTADVLVEGHTELTPEQEYYLGRGVAAAILRHYTPLYNAGANEYLNLLGQSLALHATGVTPVTGYFFMLLDSPDANAFSAPGGFVLITRGLLSALESEEELAAVLAHEIAHVQLRHGVDQIEFNRRMASYEEASSTASGKVLSSKVRSLMNQVYSDSVDSVVNTLLNKGYTSSDETAADSAGLSILDAAGYSRAALAKALSRLEARSVARGGFSGTHPALAERIAVLDSGPIAENPVRQERFEAALRGL